MSTKKWTPPKQYVHGTEFELPSHLAVLVLMPDTTEEDPEIQTRPDVTLEVHGERFEILFPTIVEGLDEVMHVLSDTNGISLQETDGGFRGTMRSSQAQQHLDTMAQILAKKLKKVEVPTGADDQGFGTFGSLKS